MNSAGPATETQDELDVRRLYQRLIDAWNHRHARAMASLFQTDGVSIGFDGSQLVGRTQIESELDRIFRSHPTAPYRTKVKEVRFLNPEVAIVRAIAGMVPPGKSDLDPALNAIQTLVAQKAEQWQVALFQNTPAQFHGRPDLVEQMTEELREV